MSMSNSDYRFFDKAARTAAISDYNKCRLGCVAIYRGHVIGMGCNCNKTHPVQKKYDHFRPFYNNGQTEGLPKLHAEINCLNQIKHLNINFSKIKLYIYRIRKDQPHGMARPCPSCMRAIKDLGIKHIYYTTDDGYVNERIENIIVGGVI